MYKQQIIDEINGLKYIRTKSKEILINELNNNFEIFINAVINDRVKIFGIGNKTIIRIKNIVLKEITTMINKKKLVNEEIKKFDKDKLKSSLMCKKCGKLITDDECLHCYFIEYREYVRGIFNNIKLPNR